MRTLQSLQLEDCVVVPTTPTDDICISAENWSSDESFAVCSVDEETAAQSEGDIVGMTQDGRFLIQKRSTRTTSQRTQQQQQPTMDLSNEHGRRRTPSAGPEIATAAVTRRGTASTMPRGSTAPLSMSQLRDDVFGRWWDRENDVFGLVVSRQLQELDEAMAAEEQCALEKRLLHMHPLCLR